MNYVSHTVLKQRAQFEARRETAAATRRYMLVMTVISGMVMMSWAWR